MRTLRHPNWDDAMAVTIYFVNISAYDEVSGYRTQYDEASQHEPSRNLREHIYQFSFHRTPVLLHFTHLDDFAKKLESHPVRDYFSDYLAGPGVEEALSWFLERFRANWTVFYRPLLQMSLSRCEEPSEPEMEVMASRLEKLITGGLERKL